MSSLCWECKYEHSDCKGVKWIEKVACPYFSKKLAINYPKIIEELERKVEFFESLYQGQLDTNEKLLLRADRLEAEGKELKAELDICQAKAYEYDKLYDKYVELNAERNELKADNEKFKEHIKSLDDIILKLKDERGDCFEDCSACEVKCRGWQNGFNHNRPTTEIIGTKVLIESYIDRLQNCGLGKKKSLEYVSKFISCVIVEGCDTE